MMLETIAVIVSFGWIVFGIRWLGSGTESALGGIFATAGQPDWPHGVQEEDAPRFVFGAAAVQARG
jgi:hypothetical protein